METVISIDVYLIMKAVTCESSKIDMLNWNVIDFISPMLYYYYYYYYIFIYIYEKNQRSKNYIYIYIYKTIFKKNMWLTFLFNPYATCSKYVLQNLHGQDSGFHFLIPDLKLLHVLLLYLLEYFPKFLDPSILYFLFHSFRF